MGIPGLSFSVATPSSVSGNSTGAAGSGDRNTGLTIYRDDPMSKWLMYGAIGIALFVAFQMVRK